jgi:hypothetical protein
MKTTIKLFFPLIACAFACTASPDDTPPEPQETEPGDETTVFLGTDNGAPLSNPLMGWQCSGSPEEIVRLGIPGEFDVAVVRCSWDKLEPTKNGYDFDLLDRAVQKLRQTGKSIFFRLYLMPDNVWNIAGYPQWIKDEPGVGAFKRVHFDNINGNGPYDFEHPDYSSPVWQGLVAKFLKYVAAHYPDGAIDVIDTRAYGLYGEWDSNWGNYWDVNAPGYPASKTAVLTQILNIYKDAFKDYRLTKISINVSSESFSSPQQARAYLQQAALDKAFEAGFAVRFDGVGTGFDPSSHVMQTVLDDYFPASPVFAETWYGWGHPEHNAGLAYNSFMKIRSNAVNYDFCISRYGMTADREYRYNPNFFINGLRPNANGLQIGYRILPARIELNGSATVGGEIRFASQWINTGTGVLYRHYPLKVSLTTASGVEVWSSVCDDFNITRLVKGEVYEYVRSFRLPAGLAAGTYKVRIALVDGNGQSAIRMPVGSADSKAAGYVIGSILIK